MFKEKPIYDSTILTGQEIKDKYPNHHIYILNYEYDKKRPTKLLNAIVIYAANTRKEFNLLIDKYGFLGNGCIDHTGRSYWKRHYGR